MHFSTLPNQNRKHTRFGLKLLLGYAAAYRTLTFKSIGSQSFFLN